MNDESPTAGLLEHIFALGALFFFSDAVRSLVRSPHGQGTVSFAPDPLAVPALLFFFGVAGLTLASNYRATMSRLRGAPWVAIVPFFALASSIWSVDSSTTAKQAVWLSGSTLFGVYLQERFGIRGLLHLLAVLFVVIVIASFAFVLYWPELGIDPGLNADAWRGVFRHKNSLGRVMTLAAVVFILLGRVHPVHRPFFSLLAMAAALLLVMTRSAANLVILVGLVVLFYTLNFVTRWRCSDLQRAVRIIAPLMLGVVLAVLWYEPLLELLGKDATFTGRTILWAAVAQEITTRPWLGFGYQAFWNGSTGEFSRVWALVAWEPPNAHNGYLDVVLHLGIVGGLVYAAALLSVGWSALRHANQASAASLWPLLFIAYFLVTNLSETTLVQPNTIFWILFCAVASAVARPGSNNKVDALLETRLSQRAMS